MDILEVYKKLYAYRLTGDEVKPYTPPPVQKRKYVVPQAKPMTLADSGERSRDLVTAHNLSDYRRTSFNLILLPHVELSYDIIAEEVYGLSEYIRTTS